MNESYETMIDKIENEKIDGLETNATDEQQSQVIPNFEQFNQIIYLHIFETTNNRKKKKKKKKKLHCTGASKKSFCCYERFKNNIKAFSTIASFKFQPPQMKWIS